VNYIRAGKREKEQALKGKPNSLACRCQLAVPLFLFQERKELYYGQ
jgi:hypothetical protein